MAFERVEGPIGNQWQDETSAATHEQLQRLNHIQGAAHFTSSKRKTNPVPKPKHYPRPWEMDRRNDEDTYDPGEDQTDIDLQEEGGDDGDDH